MGHLARFGSGLTGPLTRYRATPRPFSLHAASASALDAALMSEEAFAGCRFHRVRASGHERGLMRSSLSATGYRAPLRPALGIRRGARHRMSALAIAARSLEQNIPRCLPTFIGLGWQQFEAKPASMWRSCEGRDRFRQRTHCDDTLQRSNSTLFAGVRCERAHHSRSLCNLRCRANENCSCRALCHDLVSSATRTHIPHHLKRV